MTGICKLRGHKDAVTGLGFVDRMSQKFVVSVSKDTLFKVKEMMKRRRGERGEEQMKEMRREEEMKVKRR